MCSSTKSFQCVTYRMCVTMNVTIRRFHHISGTRDRSGWTVQGMTGWYWPDKAVVLRKRAVCRWTSFQKGQFSLPLFDAVSCWPAQFRREFTVYFHRNSSYLFFYVVIQDFRILFTRTDNIRPAGHKVGCICADYDNGPI